MAKAVCLSMAAFVIRTPPKALSGSLCKAASQASCTLFRNAIPQTFVCLMMAKKTPSKSAHFGETFKSSIKFIAASVSTRLLYESSLP